MEHPYCSLSCHPAFRHFSKKKRKKKSCSASAVSALGGGSCPSVPYKAPHLGGAESESTYGALKQLSEQDRRQSSQQLRGGAVM